MKRWAAALLLAWATLACGETWRFALIGDTPYSDLERAELPRMLDSIADASVDFVAHIGDFKNGRARCDDSLYADRVQVFSASRVPLVYVPGDNDWSDCERVSNGGYAPLERLDKLRELFWSDAFSLGQRKLPLDRQPGAYREHSRFQHGPLLFVTLNLPGGGNNAGLATEARAEYLARMPRVLEWISESFALARQHQLAGIVLLFQANPGFPQFNQGVPKRGYQDFLERLREESRAFPGQVLAVHGDTHMSRIDQPLRDDQGKTIRNFTRVETFGYPAMGWTRVIVDPANPGLFRFETYPRAATGR
jgi:hypothetical protein